MRNDGTLSALGAVGLLAGAALLRRGSRNDGFLDLGYHCSGTELGPRFWGYVGEGYASRFSELFEALPFALFDRLQAKAQRQGLGDLRFDRPSEYEDLVEDWGRSVAGLLDDLGVRWIWVAELPLSYTGSILLGGNLRSSYGDWCYKVRIRPDRALGWFEDHATAGGRAGAFAVLYAEGNGDSVRLEEVDPQAIDPDRDFIDFPQDELSR